MMDSKAYLGGDLYSDDNWLTIKIRLSLTNIRKFKIRTKKKIKKITDKSKITFWIRRYKGVYKKSGKEIYRRNENAWTECY